jgi:regulator of protease activity HflC (stomatin/prohibitin superfamily)
VEDKIYPPGSTYFFVPLINDWNTFDTRLNALDMTGHVGRGDRPTRDDMVFKTIDGNDISLDVVISWRIDPQQAPKILREVARDMGELKDNIVRTVTRSKPRDLFGELQTEEFYHPEKRKVQADTCIKELNTILNPYGVIIEQVGLNDYRFNPEYQKAIEDRKVADQTAEKNKSQTKAQEEANLRKIEEAKGEVGRMKAEADGEFERAKLEADAYYAQQKSLAEATLAEGKADAEAITRMNEALAGSGGESLVKLAIAEALSGKRIVMVPSSGNGLDVRQTDVNEFLQMYGLNKLGEKPVAKDSKRTKLKGLDETYLQQESKPGGTLNSPAPAQK